MLAQLAKKLSDMSKMKQAKQGIMSFQHIETQYFKAVGDVKTKADTYHKHLIYSINFQKLDNKSSQVLKSSR